MRWPQNVPNGRAEYSGLRGMRERLGDAGGVPNRTRVSCWLLVGCEVEALHPTSSNVAAFLASVGPARQIVCYQPGATVFAAGRSVSGHPVPAGGCDQSLGRVAHLTRR